MEPREYFDKILLPFYNTFSQQQIEMCVRDISGNFLFVSDSLAEKSLVAIPKNYYKFANQLELDKYYNRAGTFKVIQSMIKNKRQEEYILLQGRTDGATSKVIATPIFTPAGEFIASQAVHTPISFDSIGSEFFLRHRKRFNLKNVSLTNILSSNFTDLEECVLALLLLKYSQEAIATLFGCSRSYIAKIISENLCMKFGIVGFSAKLLIEKAVENGYHGLLPKSLLLRGST